MTVKIAVVEPIPTANATTASSATPGAVFQEAQAWEMADSTSRKRLLTLQLLEHHRGVGVGRVERERFLVVLDRQRRVAADEVRLAEAVVDIGGVGIRL